MAARCKLSPYLPAKPMTTAQRALFEQYRALAYQRANAASRKYGHQPKVLLQTAALIGLMYAAVRYETPSAACFYTFATRTVDWTIRNVVQHDMGMKPKKTKRAPVERPQERFEPSAYQAAGELPEAFYDGWLGEQVLVDRRTAEQTMEAHDRTRQAERILEALAREVNPRQVEMLKRHLDDEPLARIAVDYGISRERVRQLVEKTLKHAERIAKRAA